MLFMLFFLLCACIFDFVKNKKIYSPTFIFNFVWLITLSLYELKLSTLQQDLSNRTILIFWICIITYNTICVLMKHIKMPSLQKKIKLEFFRKNFSVEKKVKIAKWIAIIIFIIQTIYSGGLPLIWKLTGDSKIYFDYGIPSLTGAWYGLVICLGAYSCSKKGIDKYIYMMIGILILSRQIIMSIIIEAIFFMILNKSKKISFKKLVLVGIIVFIGFNFLGNLRSGDNAMDTVFYPKEEYKELPSSFKWIYSYMTFSISNFNNLVGMTDGGVNYGVSMLSEILPTVVMDKVNLKPNYDSNYLVLINFNVSTYLPSAYLDFGLTGIFLVNLLIGAIGIYLYKKYNKKPNIKNRLLYSVFLHNIVFLFFINMFFYLPIICQYIYIWIIFKEREENEENGKTVIDISNSTCV